MIQRKWHGTGTVHPIVSLMPHFAWSSSEWFVWKIETIKTVQKWIKGKFAFEHSEVYGLMHIYWVNRESLERDETENIITVYMSLVMINSYLVEHNAH